MVNPFNQNQLEVYDLDKDAEENQFSAKITEITAHLL